MDIFKETLKVTCELYSNLRISRSDVQFVIEIIQNFIEKVYNPFLYNELCTNICNAVDDEVS